MHKLARRGSQLDLIHQNVQGHVIVRCLVNCERTIYLPLANHGNRFEPFRHNGRLDCEILYRVSKRIEDCILRHQKLVI